MNEMKLKIVYLPTESLTPYEGNAKLHTEEQIDQIVRSIEEFGMNDPIGIWGEKNLIIEGHGRLEACKKLKMKQVPCIRLDDLTDEQRRAYTLVHNKLTLNSGFDLNLLSSELEDITFDMTEFGFDSVAMDEGFGTDFQIKDGDREPFRNMNFTFSDEQAELIEQALSKMKQTTEFKQYESDNQNSNGNALYLIVEQWLQLKR